MSLRERKKEREKVFQKKIETLNNGGWTNGQSQANVYFPYPLQHKRWTGGC